jgi:arylformamidase
MNVIDLTVQLSKSTPVYPGDPNLEITEIGTVKKDGFLEHSLVLPTHIGTHIDAPAHMIRGGRSISDYLASKFIGNGVVIDARNGYGQIDLTRVIKPESIILFNTG